MADHTLFSSVRLRCLAAFALTLTAGGCCCLAPGVFRQRACGVHGGPTPALMPVQAEVSAAKGASPKNVTMLVRPRTRFFRVPVRPVFEAAVSSADSPTPADFPTSADGPTPAEISEQVIQSEVAQNGPYEMIEIIEVTELGEAAGENVPATEAPPAPAGKTAEQSEPQKLAEPAAEQARLVPPGDDDSATAKPPDEDGPVTTATWLTKAEPEAEPLSGRWTVRRTAPPDDWRRKASSAWR